jgi:mRNA-degrading endonuclease toxin of MazEF toxin-antitoxin module
MPVKRGDIVLVPVPDTSASPVKLRPALIVSSDRNNQRLRDVIVAVITVNIAVKASTMTCS